ncbi:MAG: hypothetical protein U9N76_05015 [Candidatus Marinimicrobia bacterium]|nr:hypothetical protein [Candidatus Neomarinimicrobiota bacterium]
MKIKKNYKKINIIFLILITAVFTISQIFAGEYKSYGNEMKELINGPGGELYYGVFGLLQNGSENVNWNPMRMKGSDENNFYLYHSIWFNNNLTASSIANSFNLSNGKQLGIMVSRIGIERVPDSRDALMDYGEDGIPGTNDAGEGNGKFDSGERINYDNVSFKSLSNYIVNIGMPFRKIFSYETGITMNFYYSNLIAENGIGISFDFFAYKEGKYFNSLIKIENLPSAMTVYTNGEVELYSPTISGNWVLPIQLKNIKLNPGISSVFVIGENREEGMDFDSFGNLEVIPSVQIEYKNLFNIGIGYREYCGLMIGSEINFKSLNLQYTIKNSDLGMSHLVAIKFSLMNLLKDS